MSKSGTSDSVAVTGVGGGVGQAVLRALALSDFPCRIIGTDIEPWSAGLYAVCTGYIVPPADAPDYISCLAGIIRAEGVDILIPGTDTELPFLAEARDFLSQGEGCKVLVGSPESVRLCRDKLAASIFFAEKGLPFVRTVPFAQASELAREVGFPLLIKPRGGSASRGVRVVFSEDELDECSKMGEELIAQEYLVPQSWGISSSELRPSDVMCGRILRQEEELSVQILFDHEGNTLGRFTSRNVLRAGVPVWIDPWPNAPVEPLAERMARWLVDLGLIGPCNLQGKLTKRGPIFFEINPRFTGITAVRAAMGFNEVEALLRRVLFKEPVEEVQKRLHITSDLVCTRYITELIVSRRDVQLVRKTGHVRGRGWSTTL